METPTVIGKKAEGKKVCPTCNQVINSRVLKIRKAHVTALIKSVEYIARHKTKTIAIRDLEKEADFSPTEYGNFAELKRMLPNMVTGTAGEYTFNTTAVMDFLQGGEIVTEFLAVAGQKRLEPVAFGNIRQIKGSESAIEGKKWITEYKRPELELNQLVLV